MITVCFNIYNKMLRLIMRLYKKNKTLSSELYIVTVPFQIYVSNYFTHAYTYTQIY